MKNEEIAPVAVELENVIIVINGEGYNLAVLPEVARRYETAKNSNKKEDRDFVFNLTKTALLSAIKEIKSSIKADSAKRSRKTRAAVVTEIILDYPKFEKGFKDDAEKNEFLSLVAEAGKKYSLEPNDAEAGKFNYPKVRDAIEVIRSRYNLVLKAIDEV